MAKRKLEEDKLLAGYVHDLTPIKMSKSNAKYFNCTLQTDTSQYQRLVCFDAVKRSLFETAEQSKMPIELKEIKQLPSKDTTGTDILVNSRSQLQCLKKNEMKFHHHPKSQEGQVVINLEDVKTLPERTMVSACGVVTNLKDSTVQMVYGSPVNQQDIVIADDSAYTELVLWDHQVNTLEINKSYKFINLSTRNFKGRRHLTTTKSTRISALVEDLQHVLVPENPYTNVSTITGTVTEVCVNVMLMCNSCTKKSMNIDITTKFARCPSCRMNQLTKTYTRCMSATFNVKSNAEDKRAKLTAFDTALNNFLLVQGNENLLNDAPRLEEYFLETPGLSFEFSEDSIVHAIKIN